ncbi:MAG: HD domain-containing protein [Patescibacteria group bacterium]
MKNYNYNKIRKEVRKLVKEASYSKNNKFKDTVWLFHILPVVKHSLALGRKLNADLEVLELAALLHDYAALVENGRLYNKHHLYGTKIAGEILGKFNYPETKIKHIKECIVSHRGSVKLNKKSIEAKILASVDAMSHITELADMFFLTFGVHKYKTPEGAIWLKEN